MRAKDLLLLLILVFYSRGAVVAVGERYVDPIFSKTVTTRDIEYKPGIKLDMVVPSGDREKNRMAVILVHGGSFIGGDKGALLDDAVSLAKMGYVAATINYRLGSRSQRVTWANIESATSQSVIKMAREDVESAIGWLQANSGTYNVDPNRINLLGSSAGAVAVLYAGHFPLSKGHLPATVISLMGALPTKDLAMLRKKGPATIFFHGSADGTVPQFAAEGTADKLRETGTVVGWRSFPGLGHTVDWRNSVVESEGVNFIKNESDEVQVRPTRRSTPGVTPRLTSTRTAGDANSDGIADAQDLAIWLEEFRQGGYGEKNSNAWKADFCGGGGGRPDGKVDLDDYALWYKMSVETSVR